MVALRNSLQKRAELVQKFVPRSRIRIFHNEHTQTTPLDPKLMFLCVSYYSGAFRAAWLPYETRCKRAKLVPKFVPGCRVGILHNEHTRSTPLDLKLTFWCVSNYLGASGTIWLLYKTRCKTGRTCAKVRATKSRRNFSQQTHLKHPIGP